MTDHYIVKNQNNHYANKHKEWVDGSEPKVLFRSKNKDEAINLVFELSSKDINLRAEAVLCELNEKKIPIVEVLNPIPEPEPMAQEELLEGEEPLAVEDTESSTETT
jgi:hypothetical protein